MRIVYTEKWASQSCEELLQAYCLYCVFMALNGIAEAFAFSKGDEGTLKRLRWLMVVNSVVYIAFSYYLSIQIGIVGLVYGNCFNMFLRATSCIYYTFKQYGKPPFSYTMRFFISIFTAPIYLGLVALALFGCTVL